MSMTLKENDRRAASRSAISILSWMNSIFRTIQLMGKGTKVNACARKEREKEGKEEKGKKKKWLH